MLVGLCIFNFHHHLNKIQVWSKLNHLQLHSGTEKYIKGIRSDRVPEELWMEVYNIV